MTDIFEILLPEIEVGENSLHIRCNYKCGDYGFSESFSVALPDQIEVDKNSRDSSVFLLAIAGATSYYKAFNAQTISIDFPATNEVIEWAKHLFDEGLREFRFHNEIDYENVPNITASNAESRPYSFKKIDRILVPIGGGKDSATSLEILQSANIDCVGFSIGAFTPIETTAHVAGVDMVRAIRTLDPLLFELNSEGYPNGHIPVTAITSTLAVISALYSGANAVAMSNESSADEPTRIVGGVEVNHQWSKSSHAEKLLREAIFSLGIGVEYFSLLRNLNEVEIFSIFSASTKYHKAITSCNNAFKIDESKRTSSWCSNCDKCRFVYLGLCAYIDSSYVADIFGKDLKRDETQIDGFLNLVEADSKPFECVGSVNETRLLARRACEDVSFGESVVGKSLLEVLNKGDGIVEKKSRIKSESFIPATLMQATIDLQKNIYSKRLQVIIGSQNIGVMGLGRDTSGIIRYLRNNGISQTISVYLLENKNINKDQFKEELEKNGLGFIDAIELVDNTSDLGDLVFVSPGISKYSDEVISLGETATTPLAYWLEVNKELLPTKIFIGVTGTKGKSTTSSMIAHVLDNSIIAGNLGNAVGDLEIEELLRADYIVLEVSSFQASYVNSSPDVVAFTSLFDCHIDWHRTPENYRLDKINLAVHGSWATFMPNQLAQQLGLQNIDIQIESKDQTLRQRNENLVKNIVKTVEPNLLDEDIEKRLSTFESLKYRQEIVGVKNGVTYISDVLSTAPEASVVSVDDVLVTYPDSQIYLLFGGAHREVDQSIAINELNKKERLAILTLPDTGHMSENLFKEYMHCDELVDSIKYVSENAKEGDIVLLAPGAPSFHRYQNYEKLHEHFAELVSAL